MSLHGRRNNLIKHQVNHRDCDLKQEKGACAYANLLGPFRLKSNSGEDITPGSPLRQAILAVLVTAPEQNKSRKLLQEMFWGSAGPERASANLRTALYLLKRDIEILGKDAIRTDRNIVSIAPSRIVVDAGASHGASFLEGMDLPLEDCELFEDWLRDLRTDKEGPAEEARRAPAALRRPAEVHVALGFLPTLCAGLTRADIIRADAITDAIAHCIAQTTLLDVHDLRGYGVQAVPLPIESGTGATHFLQAVVQRRARQLRLSFRLTEAGSRKLIWTSESIDALACDVEELAPPVAEILVEKIAASPAADAPDMFPWTALRRYSRSTKRISDEPRSR